MYTNLPRAVRFLRLQKGWSQAVLAARAGVSRQLVSRIERDRVAGITFATVDRVATTLGATLRVTAAWQGEQLDRLMDAGHAALQQAVAEMLSTLCWIVRAEVSFNHYGDRGRVDLVAFNPVHRLILVVEVKTALGDLQETLGRLDVKTRVGRRLAHDLGWTDVHVVVPFWSSRIRGRHGESWRVIQGCSAASRCVGARQPRGSAGRFSRPRPGCSGSRTARIHTR